MKIHEGLVLKDKKNIWWKVQKAVILYGENFKRQLFYMVKSWKDSYWMWGISSKALILYEERC